MPRDGRPPKQFSFTYEDISRAVGISVPRIHTAVHRGVVDPGDLRSLARYVTLVNGGQRMMLPLAPPTPRTKSREG